MGSSTRAPGSPVRALVAQEERDSVRELPDLMERINNMGLTEEYLQFRSRYLGWRQGGTEGASGELTSNELKERRKTGWGHWYPSVKEWKWRRTLSYWIAVTFLEGALFFMISSFLWCYPTRLGRLKDTVTTWGYICGKINFFICTYLMCLETINLSNTDSVDRPEDEETDSSEDSQEERRPQDTPEDRWRWWPFHVRTAVRKLHALGAGPWPYYASAIYFIGVLTMSCGLAVEYVGLPEEVTKQVSLFAFLIGSLCFVLGGAAECIENDVFSLDPLRHLLGGDVEWKVGNGWWGALLNFIAAFGFLTGAVLNYVPGVSWEGSFAYGVGSAIYVLGGVIMIVMWKDEQFGLTFLAVLNQLGDPRGRPLVARETTGDREEQTLSWPTALFIIVYIFGATVSVYDTMISMNDMWHTSKPSHRMDVLSRTFNRFLPCIFAHSMLALTSGVYRAPKVAPFRQLYIACRFIGILMCINSTAQFVSGLQGATEVTLLHDESIVRD